MKNTQAFREFTFGWILIAFMVPVLALLIYLLVSGIGDRPLTMNNFILVGGLMLLAVLLFYGLTTVVTDDKIVVSFGVGLLRKTIPIKRIASVEVVTSPLYWGWGIRVIPNGMMYNIQGRYAVELKFNDTGRVFRIGSKQPAILKKQIEARIKS